jgi:hypothetical protein
MTVIGIQPIRTWFLLLVAHSFRPGETVEIDLLIGICPGRENQPQATNPAIIKRYIILRPLVVNPPPDANVFPFQPDEKTGGAQYPP